MRYHLKEFEKYSQKAITFETLDYTFYEDLVNFLTYEYVQIRSKEKVVGLKANSVGKTIKHLRTFLRNRIRKRIIPPADMEGWTIIEEDADAVYLSFSEIERIRTVDLGVHSHLNDYRDEIVLGCLTGLRFSDFSNLAENDVRGDLFFKKNAER